MLEKLIEPLWISDEKSLERVLKQSVRMEDGIICLTRSPKIANTLAGEKIPCIYVEKQLSDITVSGVDLIWMPDEEGTEPDPRLIRRIWQRHFGVPWLIAETERLLIRESVLTDLPEFIKMYEEESKNPDVVPLTEEPQDELKAYIRYRYPFYEYGLWSLVEKSTNAVIGRAGLQEYECDGESGEARIELAYLICKDWRHRGMAKEAAQAILDYAAAELGFKEVFLRTSNENRASRSLAENLGFMKIDKKEYIWRIKE